MKDKNFKVLISVEAEDKASASIDRFKKKFQSLKEIDEHFSSVERRMRGTAKAFERFSNGFKNAGKSLNLKITTPLAAFSGLGVKIAADFESEMLKAKAATKGELFSDLKNEALLAASKSMFSPSEAAQGIRWLGQGGMESKDIIDALNPTLELAASGDTELGYTADVLGGIQNTFGFKATDADKTVDKLVTTFSGSAQTLNDLGESIKYSGFMGRAANQDFDNVLFGLSTLADSNIKGSEAGTGLSSVFESFINQEPKFIKAWEIAGLGKDDLIHKEGENKGEIKPLYEIVKLLKDKKVEAKELLEMFGLQGGRTMLALLEKPIEKMEEKFKDIRDNYENRGEIFAKSRTEGFWGQFGILNSQLQTLSEKMFGASGVLKGLTDVFEYLNEYIGQYNSQLTKESAQFNLKIAGLIAVIGPLVFGFGIVISIYSKAMQWFYKLSGTAAVFRFLALRTLVLTGIVGAIVTSLYLIIENWEWIKHAFEQIANKFSFFGKWLSKDFHFLDEKGKKIQEKENPYASMRFSDVLGELFTWKPFVNKTEQKPIQFNEYGKSIFKTESVKGYEQKKTITVNLEGVPKGTNIEESGDLDNFTFNVGYDLGVRL